MVKKRLDKRNKSYGVHMSHCNQGENMGTCKYGENDICPALKDKLPKSSLITKLLDNWMNSEFTNTELEQLILILVKELAYRGDKDIKDWLNKNI